MSAVIQFFRISFSDIALGGAWHLVQLLSIYEAYLCGEPLKVSFLSQSSVSPLGKKNQIQSTSATSQTYQWPKAARDDSSLVFPPRPNNLQQSDPTFLQTYVHYVTHHKYD